MPATKAKRHRYTFFAKSICRKNGYHFIYLDNTLEGKYAREEVEKLDICDVLLITGGNTYELMRNLRRSGFDKKIVEFSKKKNTVIAGFSAGAIVLGPTLRILENSWNSWSELRDENRVGIKDLTGLGIIDYEIFPHYTDEDREALEKYKQRYKTEVKTLKDDQFLIV